MKGAILLSAAALICGLAGVIEATTCTSTTLSTCEKSLFMTGKCVDGVCTCISSDYTPGPMGCHIQQKAVISADFDGSVMTGATALLTCTTGIGADTYKWYKDGVEDAETGSVLTLSTAAVSMNGQYTCKSSIAGLLSEASDPMTITVASSFDNTLTVTGMPTSAVVGTKITFTCTYGPVYSNPVLSWLFDGLVIASEADSTYERVIDAGDAGKNIVCKLTSPALESDPVTFPGTFSDDIEGVEISALTPTTLQLGEDLVLFCKMTGEFPEPAATDSEITYAWKRDSSPVTGSSSELTISSITSNDAGLYTCEATAGTNSAKASSAVIVTIKDTMQKDDISTSATDALKKGYFSLKCNYDTPNTLLPVTYKWFLDDVELPGVTDSILQFNEADTTTFDGVFTCSVTGDDGTVTSNAYTMAMHASSEIATTTTDVTSPGTKGVGTTSTYTCNGLDFYTPGVSFIWTVDTTEQEGEVLSSFDYTPDSTTDVEIGCKYKFDGVTTSTAGTIDISPKFIHSVDITIEDVEISSLKPVAETTLELECVVVKSDDAGSVTYVWKDGSTALDGETSKKYEFQAGAASSTTLSITCEATANSVTEASGAVTVAPQATAEKPIITNPTNVVRDAEISFRCLSDSYAEGAKFEWSKDGTVISGATSVKMTIDKAASTDDGDYTCKIIVGGVTSDASDARTLTTTANEVTCTWASDCEETNMDSTACYDGVCKCLSGYTLKGGVCSGSVAVMGSLLMIVCAIITHRMF